MADAMIEAEKTPTPGRAMDESVASSWAYAVKATLAPLGAYAALTAPTQPLARTLPPGRKTPGFGDHSRPGSVALPLVAAWLSTANLTGSGRVRFSAAANFSQSLRLPPLTQNR